MKGKLFQLVDSQDNPITLIYCSDEFKISDEEICIQWDEFEASDVDDFVEFLNSTLGDYFKRVFVEEIFVI